MRLALLVVSAAVASSCVCRPLECRGSACVDEATAIDGALQSAEQQWLSSGDCFGPALGESGSGTWLVSDGHGFCGQVDYFDDRGKLRATRHCCEGDCTERGIGFMPPDGPVLRDLCKDARARLVTIGLGMYSSTAVTLTDDAGVVSPVRSESGSARWHLSPGAYEASVSAAVVARFEVPADGGLPIALEGTKPRHCNTWRCEIPTTSSGVSLAFTPALTRADGGTR